MSFLGVNTSLPSNCASPPRNELLKEMVDSTISPVKRIVLTPQETAEVYSEVAKGNIYMVQKKQVMFSNSNSFMVFVHIDRSISPVYFHYWVQEPQNGVMAKFGDGGYIPKFHESSSEHIYEFKLNSFEIPYSGGGGFGGGSGLFSSAPGFGSGPPRPVSGLFGGPPGLFGGPPGPGFGSGPLGPGQRLFGGPLGPGQGLFGADVPPYGEIHSINGGSGSGSFGSGGQPRVSLFGGQPESNPDRRPAMIEPGTPAYNRIFGNAMKGPPKKE